MLLTAIHGVDFSGAVDAGRRIWVSSGETGGARLRITESRPACELPGGARDRDSALAALARFIQAASESAIGLDFPFGLPRALVSEDTWQDFAVAFANRYATAADFRAWCCSRSAREARRVTDREARTPWAAWNWRLYRQTYYGLASILAPLVEDAKVRVLPMQAPDGPLPIVLEICPASTLRRLGLRRLPYKGGRRTENMTARRQILHRLTHDGRTVVESVPTERAVHDAGGDAVDSILAAVAVFEAITSDRLAPVDADQLEGYLYF